MEKHDFIRALRAIGRSVAHFPIFSKVFGSSNCGVFLSQMLYWQDKQDDEDGWIRKPLSEIEYELGFSRYEMDSIRKRLREALVLEEKKMGMPARLHYKFDWNRVNELVAEYITQLDVKTPVVAEEKQPNIIYRMKEYFMEKLAVYIKEAEYTWMGKDWENLKRLKELFEKRIVNKKQKLEPDVLAPIATDDEILDSFKKFIDVLPEFYRTQRYTPSFLYSDFNAIEQKVIAEQKPKTNVNKNNTPDFSNAARKAAGNIS